MDPHNDVDFEKKNSKFMKVLFQFYINHAGYSKACFLLGDFIRAILSENKNSATLLVNIGWRKNSPQTSRNRPNVPTFFSVRANKFAMWNTGLS